MNGELILAGNSLGNNLDIPQRTLNAVRSADLVIFEEDRFARRVLKVAGIHRDYLKYTEHHEVDTLNTLTDFLLNGKVVCYVSDQGMPSIADPGGGLLNTAYRLNSKISIIPGPCSVSAALTACPFLTNGYRFLGFLPRDPYERKQALENTLNETGPFVILDTPYRLKHLLLTCVEVYNSDKEAILALDISGENEEYIFATLEKLLNNTKIFEYKRNFVLIIKHETKISNKEINKFSALKNVRCANRPSRKNDS